MKKSYPIALLQKDLQLWILVYTVIVSGHTIVAQEEKNNPADTIKSKITTEGVSYSDMSTSTIIKHYSPGKQSSFAINFKVSSNLFIELQGHYFFYGSGPGDEAINILAMPLTAKKYVSNKFYLLSGVEVEFARSYAADAPPNPPQFMSTHGFGYDVNSNFTIEVRRNFNFNQSSFGTYTNPNMFSVNGKWKF